MRKNLQKILMFVIVIGCILTNVSQSMANEIKEWNPLAVYDYGNKVSYDGHIYEAKWWTQGDIPIENNNYTNPWNFIPPTDEEALEEALVVAEQTIRENTSSGLIRSATSEKWVLSKTSVVKSWGNLKSEYKYTLAIGQNVSKTYGITVTAGKKVAGTTINVGLTRSSTKSFAGPSDTAKVANSGKKVTHGGVITTLRGNIVKNTYDVYDTMGHKLRTVTQNVITNADVNHTVVYMNDGGGKVYVTNYDRSKYKTFTNFATFKSTVTSDAAKAVFY